MGRDEDALCCCEYTNEDGERSHVIASFCNCEALDLLCDRLLRCQRLDRGLLHRFQTTASDRLRVPWLGGAIRLPPAALYPIVTVPLLMVLAATSLTWSFVTYLVLLPTLVHGQHRRIREQFLSSSKDPNPVFTIKSSSVKTSLRGSAFYPSFLLSVLGWIYVFFMTNTMCFLEINAWESLVLHVLCATSITCLYLTRATCWQGFDPPSDAEENVLDGATGWRVCGECSQQVPVRSSHCCICHTCYLLRDHHCLWLDCCINSTNERWFVLGVASGALTLSYAAHLSLCVVCVPRFLLPGGLWGLLIPHDCTHAYHTWKSALAMSAAWLLVLLAAVVWAVLLQQASRIARGTTLHDRRRRRRHAAAAADAVSGTTHKTCAGRCYSVCFRAPRNALLNCYRFWYKGKENSRAVGEENDLML